MEHILEIVRQKSSLYKKDNVFLAKVENADAGLALVKDILYSNVTQNTLLFLSGGTTPKPLYQQIVKESLLRPAAVAMIDERYVPIDSKRSNEKMMQEIGLLRYLATQKIPFYGVLQEGKNREQIAKNYNDVLTKLFATYFSRIAILGVGDDGHTSGIAPNRSDFKNPLFEENDDLLVGEFNDVNGTFGERVTTTFSALKKMEILLVLVFGEKKKEALGKIFLKGPITEVPSRFYLYSDIAPKTLFITDQKV